MITVQTESWIHQLGTLPSELNFKKSVYFLLCVNFDFMYICALHMCLMPMEPRGECQILWNWSYRQW